MDTGQNQTQSQTLPQSTSDSVRSPELLSYLQNEYITFCASSGISMKENGDFEQMTVVEFARAAGVARSTLYEWQKRIPNFWQQVDQRAKEIFNQSTKYAIFKGLKLKAMTGDVKAAEMVLSHYSDYTPPAQKHEVKLSGWADLVREARNKKIKSQRQPEPIEAEVIPQNEYAASQLPQAATRVQPPLEPPTPPPNPPEHIPVPPAPQTPNQTQPSQPIVI